MREYVLGTWPLGPGDEILGEPVLDRRLMSVRAISQLLAMDNATVRQRLVVADALLQNLRNKADDCALFDIEAAAPILSELNPEMSDSQFCAALCLSPDLFSSSRDSGHLDSARCIKNQGCNPLSGLKIAEELLIGAHPVGRLTPEWVTIEGAADHMGCRLIEVVEQIRDGRFLWVLRHLKHSGFALILVDTVGLDGGVITTEMFVQSQGLALGEMLCFLRKGGSPAKIVQRDTGRKDRITLTPRQVACFNENFSSFRQIALDAKLRWDELEDRLHQQVIAPAEVCLRIYRRSEINPLLHRIPTPHP